MEDDPPAKKKVVVFGAGGFLGEHIVQQLVTTGYEVVAAVRRAWDSGYSPSQVTVIEGDLQDESFVRRALDRGDAAIFAAGRTWKPGLALREYQQQNTAITEKFFAALGQRPEMRVVFTSSLSTLTGSRVPRVFAEDSDRREICEHRLNPYAAAKICCERLAFDAAARGNQVAILNPGQLIGPGAQAASNLGSSYVVLWYCQGKGPFYIRGGTTFSDVRDVAQAHVTALVRGESGRRYILGGECLERGDFYARVARLTGLRPPRGLPAWFVSSVMAVTDGLSRLSSGRLQGPVHRSFARGEGLYYYGDSRAAADELGYKTTPLDTTIVDTLRYYHGRGLLPRKMDFVKDMTSDNAPAFALLARLADKTAFSEFLHGRIADVHEICCSNDSLHAALTRLLEAGQSTRSASASRPNRANLAADRRLLEQCLEYVYFASDEFLRKVC